ncbi:MULTISPECIES: helix-turn-helix transcriptional regulator [Clostridium]|uniref:helix-turn-helix domain-containing protein n=1 Tax=Clostridium TaxID=1485 RepID=UPI00232DB000|nr:MULTISPECIES: helix-turn-helix transcriptional regulator [Clostridium]MDB1932952.1 helix-turn-helix transcriptional regulator [Clostridium tertium]MDB1938312.1 helix-turn-helix transcriptional regulator [Clostridium tertium]
MTLKEMRLESGLKANKIAEKLNISRRQLVNLEQKKFKLSEDKVEILSKLYEKDKEEIRKAGK